MLRVEVSAVVRAPRETVWETYAGYESWPRLFPTVSGVRPVGGDGPNVVPEIDRAKGEVVNELGLRRPDEIDLWEVRGHYDACFRNRFGTVPERTRSTAAGEICLKGVGTALAAVLAR